MFNDNFKIYYLPKLKVIFVFIIYAIVLGFIDSFRTAYKASNQEILDLLIGSLISGFRFSFFIFLILGMYRVFKKKENK
jgi:hypothetical protein